MGFNKQRFVLSATEQTSFLRLIEDGRVEMTAVVHVDDILMVGPKEMCCKSCVDLNSTVPEKNLVGELKWYEGC